MGRSPISPTSVPVLRQTSPCAKAPEDRQDERGDRVKSWLISCSLGNSSITKKQHYHKKSTSSSQAIQARIPGVDGRGLSLLHL